MIFSRTMRLDDYNYLTEESLLMQQIVNAIQMWYPAQHQHRRWEYALALKAFKQVFGEQKGLTVTDHGCGAGFLSPMMYWLGQNVWMYECWTMGSAEQYMMEQMRRVGVHRGQDAGTYEMRTRPLGELVEADGGVDAAFCISTLEHIGEYQKAFRDLLNTVKPGGLLGLTTDFAEHELDDYQYAGLRAGKMFTEKTYLELEAIGEENGFELLGGAADWGWSEENRLVNNYGFAALFMVRHE
jgi:SAM-dependent methyltransferase